MHEKVILDSADSHLGDHLLIASEGSYMYLFFTEYIVHFHYTRLAILTCKDMKAMYVGADHFRFLI